MSAENSEPQRKKPIGRPFAKGQSGNPGGKPKGAADLRRLLEQDVAKIHRALLELIEAGNPQAIIYAHQQIVGKPVQPISGAGGEAISISINLGGPA